MKPQWRRWSMERWYAERYVEQHGPTTRGELEAVLQVYIEAEKPYAGLHARHVRNQYNRVTRNSANPKGKYKAWESTAFHTGAKILARKTVSNMSRGRTENAHLPARERIVLPLNIKLPIFDSEDDELP